MFKDAEESDTRDELEKIITQENDKKQRLFEEKIEKPFYTWYEEPANQKDVTERMV